MARTFYLIDGHAQIFRAYYAIRSGMYSPTTGEPTHAVFGMAGMLLRLLTDIKPDLLVMAIDVSGPTFRDELYDQYKANRDAPPEELLNQEPRIFDMVRFMGIPLIGIPGAEADDVIATICKQVLNDPTLDDVNIQIVSRDKDLEQLLSPRISMFDIHKNETLDTAGLMAKRGITPEQVIDMLSLTGDTADNIPGVQGIGPKTAVKLLEEFNTIEGIYENIDKIKGKRREKLEEAKDHLPLTRKLVTLKDDVTLELDMANATLGPIDTVALRTMFQTLGFRRHVNELEKLPPPPGSAAPGNFPTNTPAQTAASQTPEASEEAGLFATASVPAQQPSAPASSDGFADSLFDFATPTSSPGSPGTPGTPGTPAPNVAATPPLTTTPSGHYQIIQTQVELDELVETLKKVPMLSVDTETIGLGRTVPICGICLAWEAEAGVYVPMVSPQQEQHLDSQTVLETLRPILENQSIPKCGHNLKYDALVLQHAGVPLRGIAFDSMIAAQLLGMTKRSLDHLAMELLGHQMIPISHLIGAKGSQQTTMDTVSLDQMVDYAAEDADISLRLYHKLEPQLQEQEMENLTAVEMPLVQVLADMETKGIRIDPDALLAQKTDLTARMVELKDKIYEAVGEPFNVDSPKQLADILFNKLGMPIIKRRKTGPSTDVEVLEKLAMREGIPEPAASVPGLILEYRRFAKLVNTYLDNLRESMDKHDGRIHASFQQLGAATGRLSSNSPNLQNIPVRTDVGRQIRKAFIPQEGYKLICADYSQIELRILAHLSQDPALLEAFARDEDIHAAVAAQVYDVPLAEVSSEQRASAKVINFGIVYGITAFGLSRRIENLNPKQAQKLITDYRTRFKGIDQFLHQCVGEALQNGYVTTILGRRRAIPQIDSTNANTRSLGERLAINTVVQGSATGDLIKKAMVQLSQRIERDNLPMRMLCQIHDELIFEVPADQATQQAQIIKQEMEQAMTLKVPLKVDLGIGDNWLEAK